MSINKTYLGYNAERLETAPAFAPYSKVIAWYDDENAFVAGDDSGRVLEVDLPFATQEIVNGMLERIRGYAYQPWTGTRAILDPAAELGDGVTINGVYSVLASTETTFDGLMLSDAAAPADEEVDHEYHYVPPTRRALRRKVTLGADYHGAKITRANGIEVTQYEADGTPKSRAKLNGDVFAMYDDSGTARLYFDPETGRYKFVGDLDISGGSINMSGGSINWGGNNPAKDKLDKDDLPNYLHKTYIDETEIYSPTIYGGTLYATDGSDLYARMTSEAFELMRNGSDTARAQMRAYSNLVELVLGAGSDEDGKNGRLYLQKGVGSVNGSDNQNVAYLNYKDANGNDSFLGFSDNDGMFLAASKISFNGTVDFTNATVSGLGEVSVGSSLTGNKCTIEASNDVDISAGDVTRVSSGDGDLILRANNGQIAMRFDVDNNWISIYVDGTTFVIDSNGFHEP